MPSDPRQHLGRLGERIAAEHFERLGYAVVARNVRTRFGELDLVVADARRLVFCEVKTRRSESGRSPWDSLGPRKQARVRAMASAYLADVVDRPHTELIRFDAIAILVDAAGQLVWLDHVEGAF